MQCSELYFLLDCEHGQRKVLRFHARPIGMNFFFVHWFYQDENLFDVSAQCLAISDPERKPIQNVANRVVTSAGDHISCCPESRTLGGQKLMQVESNADFQEWLCALNLKWNIKLS